MLNVSCYIYGNHQSKISIHHNFFNTSVADILRALDGKSLLGSLILSFCCIDHFAQGSKPGEKTDRNDYKLCVREYLGAFNEKYKALDDHIYAVRNSLIHSYGESESSKKLNLGFRFAVNEYKTKHLEIDKSTHQNVLLIDLPSFISDVICAAYYFFFVNRKNIELFVKWDDKLLRIFSDDTAITAFENSHRFLHHFDKQTNLLKIRNSLIEDIRNQCNN